MSIQCIRSERGFLDTSRLSDTPAVRRPGAIGAFFSEAGEMLRGAIEAPLRHADDRALDGLQNDLRTDIGIGV